VRAAGVPWGLGSGSERQGIAFPYLMDGGIYVGVVARRENGPYLGLLHIL